MGVKIWSEALQEFIAYNGEDTPSFRTQEVERKRRIIASMPASQRMMSTRFGLLTPAAQERRASKKARREDNLVRRALENQGRAIRAKGSIKSKNKG